MSTETNKSGAVLVLGAGITGIQSSLDLADAGFKVYLVEKGQSIGGVMPKLDKTFPTNDCAMCILAPKLVETGRHPNIEIICNAELKELKGELGNFEVKIIKHSNYVNQDLCNGCGDCVQYCPVSFPSKFDEGVGRQKAIFRPFPQAIPNVFNIKKEGDSPCRLACPAETNAQGYLALASEGKWAEALIIIRQRLPFPGTLGRICHHPCEKECNRQDIDEPVAICDVKRFIADYVYENPGLLEDYQKGLINKQKKNKEEGSSYQNPFKVDVTRGKNYKVAVVGAGPAGLTAALDLSKQGYEAEVFEAEEVCGGAMQSVIPNYRLDKDYLQKEIQMVLEEGKFKIHYQQKLGMDFTLADLKKQDFDAVFISIGAQLSKNLSLKNSDAEGIYLGMDFLKKVNRGELSEKEFKGKNIVVVGGGNVAMDVARSSRRLGSNVTVVCLESREEIPASEEEVELAEEEGVNFMFSTSPDSFIVETCVKGMKCVKVEFNRDKETGAFNINPIAESDFSIDCDLSILAIGQNVNLACLPEDKLECEKGLIQVDRITLETSLDGVFAGGDVVTGSASVVEAISAGHEAAISIDRYLHQEDLKAGRKKEQNPAPTPQREHYFQKERLKKTYLPLEERLTSFKEVLNPLTPESVREEAGRCLNCAACSECLQCVVNCGRGAINHDMKPEERSFNVGAVIVSAGLDKYEVEEGGSFGFNLYPNVLTSLQFERMLSASGPFKGHIKRLSDGKAPKKVAWLQCVGSRDESCDQPYCSSVCCMYATKEAVIAKEHEKGLDTHIYYMDIRSMGKNFERYVERAKEEYGVVYRRTRVPQVKQNPHNNNLIISYVDKQGKVKREEYDMVVLSVGVTPCKGINKLSDVLDIDLNQYGFVDTPAFQDTYTSREGVYVAGVASEPKDIPESVTEASGAAADVSRAIFEARGTEIFQKEYPPELNVVGEQPRIGVFICRCGTNIAGTVDVPAVVEMTKELPFVVYARESLYTCSQDTQEFMKEKIKELDLNRIVVASCTPRTHESLFQNTIMEAGLNPYLFEMANIRDQCSWVHRDLPQAATEKAKDLVKMAVSKAAKLYPVKSSSFPLVKKVLVIGGGVSGMQAALSIADQGYEVFIIEKEEVLGGEGRKIYFGFKNENPRELINDYINKVNEHPHIQVLTNTTLQETNGYVGNFTSRVLNQEGKVKELQHGVIILATGAKPYQPKKNDYLYGKTKKVVVQHQFEKMLAEQPEKAQNLQEVVMIQCVGSRNDENPYCSRVCCSEAIKNALKLKEINPQISIYILYRDIRTYGFKEDFLYREARKKGIIFVSYEKDQKPQASLKEDEIEIILSDPILQRELILHPDKLVLSVGMVAGENEEMAQLLKVPLNEDRFYVEAHTKLKPVEFANEGIFLCGTAHSPRFMAEAISQAKAVASRAGVILAKDKLKTKGIVVQVNERKCVGCEICVDICSYEARQFDSEKGYVTVNSVLCQGCGACAAACPNKATQQNAFTSKQMISVIDSYLNTIELSTKEKSKKKVKK